MSNMDGRGVEGVAETVMDLNKPYNCADVILIRTFDRRKLEEIQRPQV